MDNIDKDFEKAIKKYNDLAHDIEMLLRHDCEPSDTVIDIHTEKFHKMMEYVYDYFCDNDDQYLFIEDVMIDFDIAPWVGPLNEMNKYKR